MAQTPRTSPHEAFLPPTSQRLTQTGLISGLGLFSATAIVIGSMVGSGIYIVEADMARTLGSPALLVLAWVITAIITMIGALSYGELAAMMPHAGGQYVYLREAFGPLWGFLYGWTFFTVIQTGSIAAVAVAFGKFLGILYPSISTTHWIWHMAHVPALRIGSIEVGNMEIGLNTANLVAIGVIVLLAVVNCFGVVLGAMVQNVFTSAKAISLAALILITFTVGIHHAAMQANFGAGFFHGAGWSTLHPLALSQGGTLWVNVLIALGVTQVGSLFSSDSWNNITFTASEVRNPQRTLPLSLVLGVGFVLTCYILATLGYMMVVPLLGDPHGATIAARGIQFAAEDRVGTAVLEEIFHSWGATLMAGAILISTFGCVNGLSLAGARVYLAMSRDRLFFPAVGRLHPRFRTPATGLLVQAAWAAVLCLSGSYAQLLDYIIFAVLMFNMMTILGIYVLRVKKPEAERPYRAWGYPVVPAIYIVLAAAICVVLLRYKPQFTWPGLALVLMGVPCYFVSRFLCRCTTTQS
jgi:basic amino acid/polyamine antiporter, APA family